MINMNNGTTPAQRIATGIYVAQAASELSNVKDWEAEWKESKVGHDHHIFKKHPVAICGFWGYGGFNPHLAQIYENEEDD